jgi:hypothetical protein
MNQGTDMGSPAGLLADVTIFAGRFGSGKTEVALNYALALARGWEVETGRRGNGAGKGQWRPDDGQTTPITAADRATGPQRQPVRKGPILIDLDLVTPYFRSREMSEAMGNRGVEVVAPSAIGQHLDTPAITPQILGAIQQVERLVVLDVGGDQQGARALAQYRSAIRQRGYVMHFVVNPYRPFTSTGKAVARSIAEIESSSRLKVTSLVSNPNLMGETTPEEIQKGHYAVEAFAHELDLPIAFICVDHRWWRPNEDLRAGHWASGASGSEAPMAGSAQTFDRSSFARPVLPLERYFVLPWE